MMGAVNVTVRIDEDVKREFDGFCDNVGINITTAFNMFIRATLRTRQLPFTVTDVEPSKQARKEFGEAFRALQEQSVINGTDKMSLDEINDIIAECRQEMKAEQFHQLIYDIRAENEKKGFLTEDEINEEIKAYRNEKRLANA